MSSSTVVLPLAQVNAFLLQKQHLASGSRLTNPLQVATDICALHATSPLTPYLSLWSRTQGFRATQLDDELYEQRALTKILCMRSTLHAVPTSRLPVFFHATRLRIEPRLARETEQLLVSAGICRKGQEAQALRGLQQRMMQVLTSRGPATTAELGEWLPELRVPVQYSPDKPYTGRLNIGSRIVLTLAAQGLLVRARPRGSWRSNLYEYSLLQDWLPAVSLEDISPEQARLQLVQWYLAAFGPASAQDMAWWTGCSLGEIGATLAELRPRLTEVQVHSLEGTYWMLSSDMVPLWEATLPLEPWINLLPSLDPYIMGYKDRRRFLPSEHYDQVFDRSGNALPSVWQQGSVIGVWQELERGIEILTWEELDDGLLQAAALPLARFLSQEDHPTQHGPGDAEVLVRKYPQDMYASTPFSLGRRQ